MPGDFPLAGNVNLDGVVYTIVGGGQISVTSYGLVGQFITASVSSVTLTDGTNFYPFDCTINIKRDL